MEAAVTNHARASRARAARRAPRARRKARGSQRIGRPAKAIVGRVVIAVCALAVCAVPPLFVNDVIGYLPLVALVLVIVLSFVYLQILKRSFSFSEASLAPSCERGSRIDFVLEFRNASPLVCVSLEPSIYISDLFGDADEVTPVSLTLLPRETREFHFEAKFEHIGTYAAGVRSVMIGDLLGLFSHTIVNDKRHRVEVLPRVYELEDASLSSEASSDSVRPRKALTIDDLDYAGVRDYVWGDPIKTIHWNLSARNPSGEYLTRLFEAYDNPGITIVIDTSAPDYDSESLMCLFDAVVESALSINRFAVAQGLDAVITFRGRFEEDLRIRVRDTDEFPELVNALPRISVGDARAAQEIVRRELYSQQGNDNVAVCTSHVDEQIVSMLVALRNRRRNPLLFLAVPPALDRQEVSDFVRPLRPLDEVQIPYYVFSSASQLGIDVGEAEAAAEASKAASAQEGTVREVAAEPEAGSPPQSQAAADQAAEKGGDR